MNTIDAYCAIHNRSFRWQSGIPRLCPDCYKERREIGSERLEESDLDEVLIKSSVQQSVFFADLPENDKG